MPLLLAEAITEVFPPHSDHCVVKINKIANNNNDSEITITEEFTSILIVFVRINDVAKN